MADDNKKNNGDRDDKDGEFKSPARPWIIWLAIAATIPLLLVLKEKTEIKRPTLTYSEFIQKVDNDLIKSGVISFTAWVASSPAKAEMAVARTQASANFTLTCSRANSGPSAVPRHPGSGPA